MSRIAIVTPDVDPALGGVERFCGELGRAAEAAGHSVELVTPPKVSERLSRCGLAPIRQAATAKKLVEFIGPDLVVTNGPLGATFGARYRRVHVYHGVMLGRWRSFAPDDRFRYRARLTAGMSLAELLGGLGAYRVAVSQGAANDVRTHLHLGVHRVIDNGVDVEVFKPLPKKAAREALHLDASRPVALTVGGDDYRKGSDIFVAACREAGWSPVCAGSRLAGANNLGRLGTLELRMAYSAADAVVFASRYEGASLALLEAIACGAVTLVTKVGSVPSLLRRVPSLSSCLIEVDQANLAQKLREVASGPEIFGKVAAKSCAVVRRDLSTVAFQESWTDVFARTLRDPDPSRLSAAMTYGFRRSTKNCSSDAATEEM